MKNMTRLSPDEIPEEYKDFQRHIRTLAIELLEPCKDCGRGHLANIIGTFVAEHLNEMTLIVAGANKRPDTGEEQVAISLFNGVSGTLIAAMIKMVADPNTQWDSSTMFYHQLINHFDNINEISEMAVVEEI